MNQTYYPSTNDGRADWWQNVLDNQGALSAAGFTSNQVNAIGVDAEWCIYLYRTLRSTFDNFTKAIITYADGITDAPDGSPSPAAPMVPAWPMPPSSTSGINAGLEKRREKWVQSMKGMPGYTETIGRTLGVIAPGSNFNATTYQAQLYDVSSPSGCTVSAKFRKALGNIDGINLYGRKVGATAWANLGRYTAAPCSASVPLTTPTSPEEWEFQARAVKRDVEIGLPSDIVPQIVRC